MDSVLMTDVMTLEAYKLNLGCLINGVNRGKITAFIGNHRSKAALGMWELTVEPAKVLHPASDFFLVSRWEMGSGLVPHGRQKAVKE